MRDPWQVIGRLRKAFTGRVASALLPDPRRIVRADYIVYDGQPRERWGDSWYWQPDDWWKRVEAEPTFRPRIMGFARRDPRIGDIVAIKMVSGKRLLWVVTDTEYIGDPPDMFGCSVQVLDYEDDAALPPTTWVAPVGLR